MQQPTLETARLRLRQFTFEDADLYHLRILGDSDVMRYLVGGRTRPRSEANRILKRFMEHWQFHDFGIWAVEHKANDTLIGFCGLQYLPGEEDIEIAYGIARTYWGQGLATEAARAAIAYGFETLKPAQIYGLAVPENAGSRRVLEKLGFVYQGTTTDFYDAPLVCYTIRPTNPSQGTTDAHPFTP